jgi:hypothetical protein
MNTAHSISSIERTYKPHGSISSLFHAGPSILVEQKFS